MGAEFEHDEGQEDEHDSAPAGFPGIELRITVNGLPVVQSDSLTLHYLAHFGGSGDGWYSLVRSDLPMAVSVANESIFAKPPMVVDVEVRALKLSERPDADDELAPSES